MNPTKPHCTRALLSLSREARMSATSIDQALIMATDPDCYLTAADLDSVVSALSSVVRGAETLRRELMEGEQREAARRLIRKPRVTWDDLSPQAVEALFARLTVKAEPDVEQARR